MTLFEQLPALRAQRDTLFAEAKTLLGNADRERRSLLASEQRRVDRLLGGAGPEPGSLIEGDIERLDRRIAETESTEARTKLADQARAKYAPAFGPSRAEHSPGVGPRTLDAGEIRFLRPEERIADVVADDPAMRGLTLGRYLQGVVLGRWDGIPGEARAMSVGADAAAGYLVPTPLSSDIIDKARNLAVIFKAGARTLPMESSTLTLARLAADATATWKAEGATITEGDPTFEAVILRAKTVTGLAVASIELFEDAQGIEAEIELSLTKSLALELDRAALRGMGAALEPLGILNTPRVTTAAAIGAPADYVKFADTPTRALREANALEPYTFVSSPRTFAELDALVTGIAGDKTRLRTPPAWDAYQRLVSNQVPITLGAGTDSEFYVGDFTQMVVGMRTQLTIEASRIAAYSGTASAFGNLQVAVRAYLRADVVLLHPEHFYVGTGVA